MDTPWIIFFPWFPCMMSSIIKTVCVDFCFRSDSYLHTPLGHILVCLKSLDYHLLGSRYWLCLIYQRGQLLTNTPKQTAVPQKAASNTRLFWLCSWIHAVTFPEYLFNCPSEYTIPFQDWIPTEWITSCSAPYAMYFSLKSLNSPSHSLVYKSAFIYKTESS